MIRWTAFWFIVAGINLYHFRDVFIADLKHYLQSVRRLEKGKLKLNQNKAVHFPSFLTLPQNISEMIHGVFPNLGDTYRNAECMLVEERVDLTMRNLLLHCIHYKLEEMIPATTKEYLEMEDEYQLLYPIELLNSISWTKLLAVHCLSLRLAYILMLLLNLDPKNCPVNETHYVLESMSNNSLFLRIATWSIKGKGFMLPSIPRDPRDDDFHISDFLIIQPCSVCFAFTTSKAQVNFKGSTWTWSTWQGLYPLSVIGRNVASFTCDKHICFLVTKWHTNDQCHLYFGSFYRFLECAEL